MLKKRRCAEDETLAGRPSTVRTPARACSHAAIRRIGGGGIVPLRLPLRLEITAKNLLRSKLNTAENELLIRVLCSDSSEAHYALSNRNTVQTHYRFVALRQASAVCQARWRRTCIWCHCCCWLTGLQMSGCIAFHI